VNRLGMLDTVKCFRSYSQGCGLGLDVSVSRRSRDVPTSRLGLVSRKIVNLSVSRGRRLGLVSVSAIYVSCSRLIFGQIVQATVRSVDGL